MDYKKIIKSQKVRFEILKTLKFIPDKFIVKMQYRIKTGRKLNLDYPKRYTEKLQWYKLNYHNPLMLQCADKYNVREYVKSKGLGHILNNLYAVYDKVEDVKFDELPEKFVLKTTNGSGTNIFCTDKSQLCLDQVRNSLKEWIRYDYYTFGREWAYSRNAPKIIVEEYLEDKNNSYNGINDYKFICFDGEVKFIVLDVDRFADHKRNIYDTDWNYLEVGTDHPTFGDCVPKPESLGEMLRVAKILSQDFPSVRVDLYCLNGEVRFGELTFYPWAGYVNFTPDEFDFTLGEMFNLPRRLITNRKKSL